MASAVTRIIRRTILVLALIGLVVGLRTAVLTTYYLGDAEAVRLEGLAPRTLLFVDKRSRTVGVSDDLVYQDPLIAGTTQRTLVALGRCIGMPGGVYRLDDSTTLPIPARGEEILIDSTKVELLLPLLLIDLNEKARYLSSETMNDLLKVRKHRFSRDYYLLSTIGGTHVWISREDIVGRVIGSVRSPF